ncbi:MAG: LLM class flavin-dependent oxidoreductase [Proteobacteria bacterium]|nr:LLM class flavin-dependent oxidoreductase [Pseudomonadota bacterium]
MKLGMFMMPCHDPRRDVHLALLEDVAAAVHADRVGFDEFWMGEHYAAPSEPVTSPFAFLGNLIARTKTMKLCTGMINLPQQNPAVVASHAALLDHLSEGRFIFGVSPGGLPSDFELFKTPDPKARSEMMEESVAMMLRLWQQDAPYELKGKYWDITIKQWVYPELGVGSLLKPYQKPHPPMAVSAMSPFSGTARFAGTQGFLMISGHFCAEFAIKSQWQAYCQGALSTGRTPDPDVWRIARPIFVHPDRARAQEYFFDPKGPFHALYRYLIGLVGKAGQLSLFKNAKDMPDEAVTVEYALTEFGIYGDPDTVAERILRLNQAVGPFGGIVMMAMEYLDRAMIEQSMQLMAEAVMPRINGKL